MKIGQRVKIKTLELAVYVGDDETIHVTPAMLNLVGQVKTIAYVNGDKCMLHGVKNVVWHKSMLELSKEYCFTAKVEANVSGSVFLFDEERENLYSEMERDFNNVNDFDAIISGVNTLEYSLMKNMKFHKKE